MSAPMLQGQFKAVGWLGPITFYCSGYVGAQTLCTQQIDKLSVSLPTDKCILSKNNNPEVDTIQFKLKK